jgi:hypothetical protein
MRHHPTSGQRGRALGRVKRHEPHRPPLPRRLVAERRIRFVKVGRHVRIPESAVIEYVTAHTIEPLARRRGRFA